MSRAVIPPIFASYGMLWDYLHRHRYPYLAVSNNTSTILAMHRERERERERVCVISVSFFMSFESSLCWPWIIKYACETQKRRIQTVSYKVQ
jgi:hypothetical protein